SALACTQFIGSCRRQTRLRGERMMHERDQWIPAAELCRCFGNGAKRQPVDNNRAASRNLHQPHCRVPFLLVSRKRKAIAELYDFDLPAEPLKLSNHPAIVCVAASRAAEIPGNRDRNGPYHKGASYQARATCDSERVTRIDVSSRPSRPNLPARVASESRS